MKLPPKQYLYIGGGVVLAAGVWYVMRRRVQAAESENTYITPVTTPGIRYVSNTPVTAGVGGNGAQSGGSTSTGGNSTNPLANDGSGTLWRERTVINGETAQTIDYAPVSAVIQQAAKAIVQQNNATSAQAIKTAELLARDQVYQRGTTIGGNGEGVAVTTPNQAFDWSGVTWGAVDLSGNSSALASSQYERYRAGSAAYPTGLGDATKITVL